ncbi:MAG: hypothetical protein ACF8PG_06550 [Maioricimonas sp. JB045]
MVVIANLEVDLGAAQIEQPAFRLQHQFASDAGTLMLGVNSQIVDLIAVPVVSDHHRAEDPGRIDGNK